MSWRKVLIVGGAAAAIAVGCTVNVTEGPIDGGDFGDTGGASGKDGGTGGAHAGGSAGKAGASTGGKGGTSTGGKAGAGGTGGKKDMDATPDAYTSCNPDPSLACDNCIETKCCAEWLDCANDADCLRVVNGMQEEYYCIEECLRGDGGSFATVEECAGMCKHDPVGVSAATSSLIACMRDTADSSSTQNCTTECFGREL
jgi:hypothetical protein